MEASVIKLDRFNRTDYDRLINWVVSKEFLIQFAGPLFVFPLTYEQLDKYTGSETRLIYKVIEETSNEVIGHAEINNIDFKNNSARICRVLIGVPEKRNKGYGKVLIKELIKIGFDELKLHRLDLGVFDFNKQAIKCYQDCGFEIEGLIRDSIKVDDKYWSVYNMSIININN